MNVVNKHDKRTFIIPTFLSEGSETAEHIRANKGSHHNKSDVYIAI